MERAKDRAARDPSKKGLKGRPAGRLDDRLEPVISWLPRGAQREGQGGGSGLQPADLALNPESSTYTDVTSRTLLASLSLTVLSGGATCDAAFKIFRTAPGLSWMLWKWEL